MPPRSADVYQAIPFDVSYEVSYEANEPLIIAAGDAGAEEEDGEDHRLEENAFSRFELSALLLGFLHAVFFMKLSVTGANLLVITLFGEDLATRSMTNVAVFSLFWSFFTGAMAIASLGFLRNLVIITYSAVGGRSEYLLEEMILRMEYSFFVGGCLACFMTGVLLRDIRAQTGCFLVMLVVALFVYKIIEMCFAKDKDCEPSSSHRSTAAENMTTDV
jgi:hypothetical protein